MRFMIGTSLGRNPIRFAEPRGTMSGSPVEAAKYHCWPAGEQLISNGLQFQGLVPDFTFNASVRPFWHCGLSSSKMYRIRRIIPWRTRRRLRPRTAASTKVQIDARNGDQDRPRFLNLSAMGSNSIKRGAERHSRRSIPPSRWITISQWTPEISRSFCLPKSVTRWTTSGKK